MKSIIFGANGQDGFYLSELLKLKQIEVVAVSRSTGKDNITGNVTDQSFVESIIKDHQPDFVFNLAANSTTQHSALLENHETIATGTIHVLEAVYKYSPLSKVFLSGSALQFENRSNPIKETDPFCAKDAYSAARIYTTYLARYYRTLNVKVYVGYFFNHDSPLRDARHLNKKIIDYVKALSQNKQKEKLSIGNVNVQKEFNHAKDIANAIFILVSQNEIFEAVIGNGLGYTIKDWLSICFQFINKTPDDFIVINKDYVSPYEKLICNPETLKSLGWKHTISIEQLAKEMYDYEG